MDARIPFEDPQPSTESRARRGAERGAASSPLEVGIAQLIGRIERQLAALEADEAPPAPPLPRYEALCKLLLRAERGRGSAW